MPSRVRTITPGTTARVHTWLIWSLASITHHLRYRGVQRLSWELSRILPAENLVSVQVSEDTRLLVPLGDGYWTKLLSKRYVYEPEVAAVLDRHLDSETYFLDCGANIGYWSLLGRHKARAVVAVEANPTTYRRLQANVAFNRADVILRNAALWDKDHELLSIDERPRLHAGAFVTREGAGTPAGNTQRVQSVTLQTLIGDHCPAEHAKIVIKLDVEGAEIPALAGAGELLRTRRVLIVYEDHGGDPSCKVTRHLRAHGMVTADAATEAPMSVDDVAAVKTQPWKGYNFLAYYPG